MSEWFQQNRWLGRFLIVLGIATLLSLILLFVAKGSFGNALAGFNDAATEKTRLERLDPFPSDANYKKMKVHIEDYRVALDKFKEDLKTHVLPAPPSLAPNEFQSRLRQAIGTATEKARANKVRLPENFFLGFDEYTAALPTKDAAPLLGQELSQIQMLMDIVIDARIDGVTGLKRTPLPEERGAAPTTTPLPVQKQAGTSATAPKTVERAVVDLKFSAAPSAMRKAIDQIAGAKEQLFVIRTLHVRNEKDKGPPREQKSEASTAAAKPPGALQFIVGNEHLETSVRIELVRLNY